MTKWVTAKNVTRNRPPFLDFVGERISPKRKVVGSNPARNGDAAGDFVEKTGSGGIICFQDDLSNGR